MNAALLQILAPVGVAVLGAGWAIVRYELNRYAKAHPNAPVVKTAETVIAEAKAVAPLVGITAPKVAGFISGALAAQGHVVPAKAILATEEAIQAAANADLARVPAEAPQTPAAASGGPGAQAPVQTPVSASAG